jgi:hypothetical protein
VSRTLKLVENKRQQKDMLKMTEWKLWEHKTTEFLDVAGEYGYV